MKYFLVFTLIAVAASATPLKPTVVSDEMAQIAEIVAAINHPSTDPATAAMLEQMLLESLGLTPEPIAVGPAIVEPITPGIIAPGFEIEAPAVVPGSPVIVGPAIVAPSEPISVGPAIVDFPLPDSGAVTAVEPTPVPASPAVVAPVVEAPSSAASPLVQIILNINAPADAAVADTPAASPAVTPEIVAPTPVQVVDIAPIQVVDTAPVVVPESPVVVAPAPEPIIIGTPILPEPVIVAEPTPVDPAPAPVIIGTPILPEPVIIGTPVAPVAPAVVLPDVLN